MDIKGLRYFIAAAERLNFTTAAKECYITQTAMSLHINKMEAEMGFKLFKRDKRAVELTDAGRDFLGYAHAIMDDYGAAVEHGVNVAAGTNGVLNVILPGYFEGFVFMEKFKKFREEYPGVILNLRIQTPDVAVSHLQKKRGDVAIGMSYDMESEEDIRTIEVRRDPVIVLCNSEHPLANREPRVKPQELERETFLLAISKSVPNSISVIRKKWRKMGFELNDYVGVKNMDEMLMFIELGYGIGVFPSFVRDYFGKFRQGITEIDVAFRSEPPTLTTAIGCMKDNKNPMVERFIRVFTEEEQPYNQAV
jgi:DNA-binding transcriptional LysR family regulator